MNKLEILRDDLTRRWPRKTIAVSQSAWHHWHGLTGTRYSEYVVSIQPGFDGTENQNFGGNSFDECMEKVNKAATQGKK